MSKELCKVAGCTKPLVCRGFCRGHYARMYTGKSVNVELRPWTKKKGKCSVEECSRPDNHLGYCGAHYQRLKKYGDVFADRPISDRGAIPPLVKWLPNPLPASDECWNWSGSTSKGYGTLRVGVHPSRRLVLAHRYVYEEFVDDIPSDMTLDHLCRNRLCCNPAHLEIVTYGENSRRQNVYWWHTDCKAVGCTARAHVREHCVPHYKEFFCIVSDYKQNVSVEDRIRKYSVVHPDGCIDWIGTLTKDGYPRVTLVSGSGTPYRVTYEMHYGVTIPKGMQVDHLCNNRVCINPEHLELVTNNENGRRKMERARARKQLEEGDEVA